MRYLSPFIEKEPEKEKMALLAGPRQVGKSTLAKRLLGTGGVYLNWDVRKDQRVILGEQAVAPRMHPSLVLGRDPISI